MKFNQVYTISALAIIGTILLAGCTQQSASKSTVTNEIIQCAGDIACPSGQLCQVDKNTGVGRCVSTVSPFQQDEDHR